MLLGCAHVSKTDGPQSLDLQRDALRAAGVDDAVNLYHDMGTEAWWKLIPRPGERRRHSRFEAAGARGLRLAQWVDGEACGGVHVGGGDRRWSGGAAACLGRVRLEEAGIGLGDLRTGGP